MSAIKKLKGPSGSLPTPHLLAQLEYNLSSIAELKTAAGTTFERNSVNFILIKVLFFTTTFFLSPTCSSWAFFLPRQGGGRPVEGMRCPLNYIKDFQENAFTCEVGLLYTQSKIGLSDLSTMMDNFFRNARETMGHPELLHIGLG